MERAAFVPNRSTSAFCFGEVLYVVENRFPDKLDVRYLYSRNLLFSGKLLWMALATGSSRRGEYTRNVAR